MLCAIFVSRAVNTDSEWQNEIEETFFSNYRDTKKMLLLRHQIRRYAA